MSTSYDAYQHLGADQIRQALKAQPRNIANLCRHLVATLEKGAQSAGTTTPAEAQKLLTCAALLTRVLPVLFEEDAKTHFVETVFWQGRCRPARLVHRRRRQRPSPSRDGSWTRRSRSFSDRLCHTTPQRAPATRRPLLSWPRSRGKSLAPA